jgi:RNA recognition motif-containing protein
LLFDCSRLFSNFLMSSSPSSNYAYYRADLPYSTSESNLRQEFSNFGEIAEGKSNHLENLVCFILSSLFFHCDTVFTISGSEARKEWSQKVVKGVCIYSVYLSRRCLASPRKYGLQGSTLPPLLFFRINPPQRFTYNNRLMFSFSFSFFFSEI